ncbi:MAG: hypothetical protein DCC67_00300 [Planctomycetota bacterium]|nr:MAG: hypothetical protein DCC67_00300 [Planctomycetota bacterium]
MPSAADDRCAAYTAMARQEHDREDLLRDARALLPRVKLVAKLGGRPEEVVIGFRGQAISFFFDQDPAYHFNAAGQLRRAFAAGRLLKAERKRLVALTRRRGGDEVVLQRDELDLPAEAALLEEVGWKLAELGEVLRAGSFQLIGQVPENGDALPRASAWLAALGEIELAAAPRL